MPTEPELAALDRPFKIIAFDWDGTAVPNRSAPVDEVLPLLEALLEQGVLLVIITGTHFGNVDNQFVSKVRPGLKHNLFCCVNRGSQVFGFDEDGEHITLHERLATDEDNAFMDAVTTKTQEWLREEYGLETDVIRNRFNRRKLDIIPLPEWADPPKARIGELLEATQKRLRDHGIEGGIDTVIKKTEAIIEELGGALCLTTDVKHIEYGLTDKSHSVEFVIDELARKRGIANEEILFLGDEFGPIGGFEGSDFRMFCEVAKGAVYASVGNEPNGVPEGVIHYGKGVPGFCEIMKQQIEWSEKNGEGI